MENTNQNQQLEMSWRNAQISGELPLNALVQFLNILNERLCTVEDATLVTVDEQGTQMSLTEVYIAQAQAEMEAAQQEELLEKAQMEVAQQEPELLERAE